MLIVVLKLYEGQKSQKRSVIKASKRYRVSQSGAKNRGGRAMGTPRGDHAKTEAGGYCRPPLSRNVNIVILNFWRDKQDLRTIQNKPTICDVFNPHSGLFKPLFCSYFFIAILILVLLSLSLMTN